MLDCGFAEFLYRGLSCLIKFQGSGGVLKFDVFSHCYAVCLCCLYIMFQVSKQLNWWL